MNKADASFNVASSHCQSFAFVHIAHAQFEHSQGREMSIVLLVHKHILMTQHPGYFSVCYVILPGNTKRGIYILQNAIELGARPKEQLEAALQRMQVGKTRLSCSEDKENVPREADLLSIVYFWECNLSIWKIPPMFCFNTLLCFLSASIINK